MIDNGVSRHIEGANKPRTAELLFLHRESAARWLTSTIGGSFERQVVSLKVFEITTMNQPAQHSASGSADGIEGLASAQDFALTAGPFPYLIVKRPSPWSRSGAKRFFDCACVLLALPLVIPVFLAIALAVRLTSSGPVLFLQKRMGRHGRVFTILKFRTMIRVRDKAHHAVTTAYNQCFSPAGSFLRRWKLDELPQLLNVFWGI